MKRTLSILCLAVTLAACQQQAKSESAAATAPAATHPSGASLTPEELGALGAQIRKEPARADQLLQQHGLTRAAFEQQIRDVTENADASRRYAEAYRKASA
jgi:hypothetical protein